MSWIKKGDLIEARGVSWVAVCDNYTKLVRDWSVRDYDSASAVGAVRACPAEGGGETVELLIGRDKVSIIQPSDKP